MAKHTDHTDLAILLDMDGEVFPMDNGYWTKFSIKAVAADKHIPHGIKYSLTLHDSGNRRVLGYDNAHAIRPKRKAYSGKRIVWDHKHEREKVSAYEFDGPGRLMEEFWNDVEKILGKSR